jgi:hypothetical protein
MSESVWHAEWSDIFVPLQSQQESGSTIMLIRGSLIPLLLGCNKESMGLDLNLCFSNNLLIYVHLWTIAHIKSCGRQRQTCFLP